MFCLFVAWVEVSLLLLCGVVADDVAFVAGRVVSLMLL